MRMLVLAPFLGLAACAQTPAGVAAQAQAAQAAQVGLDKALAGLTRGATSSCIPVVMPSAQTQAYGPTILYRVSPGRVYRTDTAGGCEGMARGDTLVVREHQGRPCRGDIATTIDRTSRMFTGSCSFGDFTEYSRR